MKENIVENSRIHRRIGDPALRLGCDGMEFEPISIEGGIHTFVMPPRTTDVRITSRSDLVASTHGKRASRFGIALGRIIVRSARMIREVPLDHPMLGSGFHPCEGDGIRQWRWSNGAGCVPVPLLMMDGHMPSLVEFHIHEKLPSYDVASSKSNLNKS
ncbi:hypothetical protein [Labrys sp. 22185]|uniref:hypothetical protein n=1 Tax=Labrys sp. 22185 TaxID=3453888 RepID=UPI003F835E8B